MEERDPEVPKLDLSGLSKEDDIEAIGIKLRRENEVDKQKLSSKAIKKKKLVNQIENGNTDPSNRKAKLSKAQFKRLKKDALTPRGEKEGPTRIELDLATPRTSEFIELGKESDRLNEEIQSYYNVGGNRPTTKVGLGVKLLVENRKIKKLEKKREKVENEREKMVPNGETSIEFDKRTKMREKNKDQSFFYK